VRAVASSDNVFFKQGKSASIVRSSSDPPIYCTYLQYSNSLRASSNNSSLLSEADRLAFSRSTCLFQYISTRASSPCSHSLQVSWHCSTDNSDPFHPVVLPQPQTASLFSCPHARTNWMASLQRTMVQHRAVNDTDSLDISFFSFSYFSPYTSYTYCHDETHGRLAECQNTTPEQLINSLADCLGRASRL
jgi:hypothetical protein